MTTSAATSRTRIEREIELVSSPTTTGAPVTTYVPLPFGSRQSGIATARRISPIAASRSRSVRSGRSRTWISALSFAGKM